MAQAISAQSQEKRADRFFEKNDFESAAKYYERALDNNRSQKNLGNLADSYYNIANYTKATEYYRQLLAGRISDSIATIDNEYNFKMYQSLAALDQTNEAVDYLEAYAKGRSEAFDKTAVLEEIAALKAQSPTYTSQDLRINSESADFGAVKFGDSIYFTSDRPAENLIKQALEKRFLWTHKPFLDIYAVRVDEKNDTIGLPVLQTNAMNTRLHDGNFTLSADGVTMYISRSSYDGSKKSFDDDNANNVHLYKLVKIDGQWRPAEKLPFIQEGYSYQHPSLSPDGRRLYFSSNQPGGFGSYDLYVVTVNLDGTFGRPLNLGDVINTPHREHFPFVNAQQDLFFSSDGHLGLGLLDIFVSPLSRKGYLKPINLGAPINSKSDDHSISYYSDTDGYYASNRSGNDQIYGLKQTETIVERKYKSIFEIRDEDTAKLLDMADITLLDSDKKIVAGETLKPKATYETYLRDGTYTILVSNDDYDGGSFDFEVLPRQNQVFVFNLKRVISEELQAIIAEKKIDKKLITTDKERFDLLVDNEGPSVVEKDGKLFIEVPPIYFDFDKWSIRADSKVELQSLVEKLKRYKNIRLQISSHTDTRGPAEYNEMLSKRRAENTFNFLVEQGVAADRISYAGYGESNPINPCPAGTCTEAEHQLNRRSEFEIISY